MTDKIDGLESCECYKIYMNEDKSEGEPKDIKVFFTQNYLVIATLHTVQWQNITTLNSLRVNADWGHIPFDQFNPQLLEQGFEVHRATRHNI